MKDLFQQNITTRDEIIKELLEDRREDKKKDIEKHKYALKCNAITAILITLIISSVFAFFIYGYFWNNYKYPNTTDNSIINNGNSNTVKKGDVK